MSRARRHKHRRPDTRHRPTGRVPLPPRRLDGGPLHGLTVHLDQPAVDAGVLIVRGGRYVRVDADEWMFEREHVRDHAGSRRS